MGRQAKLLRAAMRWRKHGVHVVCERSTAICEPGQCHGNSAGLGLDRTHTFSEVILLAVLSCWLVFWQVGGAGAAAEAPEGAAMADMGGGAPLSGSSAAVDADFTCMTAI